MGKRVTVLAIDFSNAEHLEESIRQALAHLLDCAGCRVTELDLGDDPAGLVDNAASALECATIQMPDDKENAKILRAIAAALKPDAGQKAEGE